MFTETNMLSLEVWQHAEHFMSISKTWQYWYDTNSPSDPKDTNTHRARPSFTEKLGHMWDQNAPTSCFFSGSPSRKVKVQERMWGVFGWTEQGFCSLCNWVKMEIKYHNFLLLLYFPISSQFGLLQLFLRQIYVLFLIPAFWQTRLQRNELLTKVGRDHIQ